MSSQTKSLYIVLAISILVTFSFYKKHTLSSLAPGHLWFNKYVEASRYAPWEKVVSEHEDLFVAKRFNDLLQKGPLSPYGYGNIPGYALYKLFSLRGENLWLAQKLLMSLLNIGTLLLIFGITRFLFGEKIAVLSSILCAFSPHIWITFNFDSAGVRSYNYFLSLLTIFLFLRYEQKKTLTYLTCSGIAMGINLLFFHMGSFATPIVIAIYCILQSTKKKSFSLSLQYSYIFCIALFAAIILDLIHSTYFNIRESQFLSWFSWYSARGSIASHSFSGIVLFDINRLSDNIAFFFNSVFINGLDEDWHYIIAPPGIPLIYSYFIFAFSIPGMYFLFKKKRKQNLFLTCWLLFFILVYSLVIIVRIKNMLLLIPPFIILATVGARFSSTYLYRTSHKWLPLNLYFKLILNHKHARKRIYTILTGILLGGSVLVGGFFTFIELPSKNFYDGGGHLKYREVYRHITNKGYSKNSSIVFTSSESLALPNLAMRLFTKGVPRFINLNMQGLPSPYVADAESKFNKIDSKLKLSSDKVFYCFISYDNHLGSIYVTDSNYEKLFLNTHPKAIPFIINGLDGNPLWKIYETLGS